MKTFIVLLDASGDLSEGERWYKIEAEKPEDAMMQLVSNLGREGSEINEALVVEIEPDKLIPIGQKMRWEVRG
jgi:hypothetical protein